MATRGKAQRAEERRLLQAVLGAGIERARARAQLWSDKRGRRAWRELERLLGDLRAAGRIRGWTREREEALVTRILARTTRARPAGNAWGRSARWLAGAAVVVGASVLGVRAVGSRAGASGLDVGSPSEVARIHAPGPRPGTADAALVHARFELAAAASASKPANPTWTPPGDSPMAVRLLDARARGLRERRWASWLHEIPVAELDSLALALWCEIELDRYVLSGERTPAFARVLHLLRSRKAEARRGAENLLAHALERARAYGLTGEVREVQVAVAGSPWTPQWFSDLEAAGREAGVTEAGPWRDWLDWRGRVQ